jgi:hypothetical protein
MKCIGRDIGESFGLNPRSLARGDQKSGLV